MTPVARSNPSYSILLFSTNLKFANLILRFDAFKDLDLEEYLGKPRTILPCYTLPV